MSSMFRSPQDISSSESDSSSIQEKVGGSHVSEKRDELHKDTEVSNDLPLNSINGKDILDGVNLDKDLGLGGIPELDSEGHAALMTAALLEHYCISRAAEILNEQCESPATYTKESPEVRLLGRRLYSYKSRILSSHGVVAPGVDGEDWDNTRQYYRESLNIIGASALDGNDLNPGPSARAQKGVIEESFTTLSLRNQSTQAIQRDISSRGKTNTNIHRFITDGATVDPGLDQFPPNLLNFFRKQQTPLNRPISLPYVYSQPYQSNLGMSRYAMEFEEECLIGKGSYGVVYRVKHHVDGQVYAVKKIPLSPRKLQQLQDRGLEELDNILKEIRTLAQLEHLNVVRYFGAWAEYSPTATTTTDTTVPDPLARINKAQALLEQGSLNNTDISDCGVVFEESNDNFVIFENSNSQPGTSSSQPDSSQARSKIRRDSRATVSSTRSKKSFVSSVGDTTNDSYDDEVESIPRPFNFPTPGQTSAFSDSSDDIFSDGLGECKSNLQLDRKKGSDSSSPLITLHIQMSLHPLSLAKYLGPQVEHGESNSVRHCYHLIPSLKLLLGILSGVEYLHAKGIIHRDLKPANVFLSPPSGNTPTTCAICDQNCTNDRICYTAPRIGDFGLVAETSVGADGSHPTINTKQRPVGTEFYRPPAVDFPQQSSSNENPRNASINPGVDESLDVYALGVILFELLYKLDTRMERQMVLSNLTCSSNSLVNNIAHRNQDSPLLPGLPNDFSSKIHCDSLNTTTNHERGTGIGNSTIAERLAVCITKMVEPDSGIRWTCIKVRQHLEEVLDLATGGLKQG